MQARGRYYDGVSGSRLDVEVSVNSDTGQLRMSHPELPLGVMLWPLAQIRALRSDGASDGQVALALRTDHAIDSGLVTTARLVLTDAALIARIERHAPGLNRRDVPKGTTGRLLGRAALALGALAVMIFVILPSMAGTLAAIIPVEREVQWGKAVVAQVERLFGGKSLGALACDGAEGQAALDRMVLRLTDGTDMRYDLDVSVFNHAMVNAFAAPGGQIVLMRGLIDAAESADEVAAVLAHEIGHVENRDATRNALRAAGTAGLLSLVIGDFTGGSIAIVLAETTLNASYTRAAEHKADGFAHDMLTTAGVDVSDMARFFEKLGTAQKGPKLPEYLSTHPATADRAERARDVADAQSSTRPVLSDADWAALQKICAP